MNEVSLNFPRAKLLGQVSFHLVSLAYFGHIFLAEILAVVPSIFKAKISIYILVLVPGVLVMSTWYILSITRKLLWQGHGLWIGRSGVRVFPSSHRIPIEWSDVTEMRFRYIHAHLPARFRNWKLEILAGNNRKASIVSYYFRKSDWPTIFQAIRVHAPDAILMRMPADQSISLAEVVPQDQLDK